MLKLCEAFIEQGQNAISTKKKAALKATWLFQQQRKLLFACIVTHPVRLAPWRQLRAEHLNNPAVRKSGIIIDNGYVTYSHLVLPASEVDHKMGSKLLHGNAKIIVSDRVADSLSDIWFSRYVQQREVEFIHFPTIKRWKV
jgi:hypothetical protein